MASRPSVQSHAADIRSAGGAQGWNIDQLAGLTGRPVSTAASAARNTGPVRGRSVSARCWVLRERAVRRFAPRTPGPAPRGGTFGFMGQHPSSNGRPGVSTHCVRMAAPVRDETGSGLPPVP